MYEEIYPFHNIDIEYSYQFVSMIGIYTCAPVLMLYNVAILNKNNNEKKTEIVN